MDEKNGLSVLRRCPVQLTFWLQQLSLDIPTLCEPEELCLATTSSSAGASNYSYLRVVHWAVM